MKNTERKMLALDLDGTLTDSEKKITRDTREALRKMQEEGHIVVLATGRPMSGVMPVAEELELAKYGGYIVAYNGGAVIDCRTGEVIYRRTLPTELAVEIFAFAEELGTGILTYSGQGMVAGSRQDKYMEHAAFINHVDIHHTDNPSKILTEPVGKCLATAPPDRAPEVEKMFRDKFGDRVMILRSEPFFIEMVPPDVGKEKGLAFLIEKTGIPRENLVACGDGYNDINMIKYAGLGVAMANACNEVKNVADVITLSNDDDGITVVIDVYIMKI